MEDLDLFGPPVQSDIQHAAFQEYPPGYPVDPESVFNGGRPRNFNSIEQVSHSMAGGYAPSQYVPPQFASPQYMPAVQSQPQYPTGFPVASPGCATGACDTYLDPCSNVMEPDSVADLVHYSWIDAIGGQQYGLDNDWSTNVGVFLPLFELSCNGYVFMQGNGLVAENETFGGSGGLVTRVFDPVQDVFWGASLFYDIEVQSDRRFQQFGAGLEMLMKGFEFRVNGNVPFSDTRRFRQVTPRFSNTNIVIGDEEIALAGVEFEAGIRPFQTPNLWIYGAYYFYEDPDGSVGSEALEGARGRLELRPNRHVTIHGSVSDDDVVGTQVWGGVTLAFTKLSDLMTSSLCPVDSRYDQLVKRRNRITTAHQDVVAHNIVTNQPIIVAQANASAPVGGDGTTARPFNSIGDAAAAAGENGIVFVRNGDFTESVELSNGQRLLADGFLDTNPHLVRTRLGVIQLPGQQNRTDVVVPSIASADQFATIKLCQDGSFVDNVEIAGLEIRNTVGSGIGGILNNGIRIHDNVVVDAAGYGIALLNASGSQFENTTAPIAASSINDNSISGNAQGGLLLADVDLSMFDLASSGVDLAAKGISTADRGALVIDVHDNSFRNNATVATLQPLGDSVRDATSRDDPFGVLVTSLTDSQITVNFDRNTLEENGLPAAVDSVDSSGGLGLLVGGSSNLTVDVTESSFLRNSGVDIFSVIGEGPNTTSAAGIDLTVTRSLLEDSQLADTRNGLLAAGIRSVADIGTLNTTIGSTVIQGDSSVFAATFDRMEAVHAVAEGTGIVTTTLIDNGLNQLGRSGNELTGWHVGLGGDALDSGVLVMNVRDTTIDAECVLKFHAGDFGDPAQSRLTADIRDSVLIARLPTTSAFDGAIADAEGGSLLSLTILDSTYSFEGIVDGSTPTGRDWLRIKSRDTAEVTFNLERTTPTNSMTGFDDFIEVTALDGSRVTGTLSEVTAGLTSGHAIEIGAMDTSRIFMNVDGSVLSGNLSGLVDVFSTQQAVVSAELTGNTFTSPFDRAVTLEALADDATHDARLGATLSANQFISTTDALQATVDATDGQSTLLINVINNVAGGDFLISQLETVPGSSITTLFDDGGNSPAPVTGGTVGSSPSLLDITFP